MRLSAGCWRWQWAPFVCGVALGLTLAALDLRTSSAWLRRRLREARASQGPQPGVSQPAAPGEPKAPPLTVPPSQPGKDPTLPTVALNVSEGREHLWSKTQAAFKYIVHEGLLENIDWVLKADDDTFLVMENLRQLLLPLDTSSTVLAGLRLRPHSPQGFMSGGAGYALSRAAALRFVTEGLSGDLRACRDPGADGEDVAIGRCMVALNATFLDSRDSEGLERFHAYSPERQMVPDIKMDWLHRYSYYNLQPASKCCSSAAVSFHYISPSAMRAMYYLIYRLKPYGLNECELPTS